MSRVWDYQLQRRRQRRQEAASRTRLEIALLLAGVAAAALACETALSYAHSWVNVCEMVDGEPPLGALMFLKGLTVGLLIGVAGVVLWRRFFLLREDANDGQ